jgi:hypothetical protein
MLKSALNTSRGIFYLSNVFSDRPFYVFFHPFKGSRLNITSLSASEPDTITEYLSASCVTCTVGPDTAPVYTELRMDWVDTYSIDQEY